MPLHPSFSASGCPAQARTTRPAVCSTSGVTAPSTSSATIRSSGVSPVSPSPSRAASYSPGKSLPKRHPFQCLIPPSSLTPHGPSRAPLANLVGVCACVAAATMTTTATSGTRYRTARPKYTSSPATRTGCRAWASTTRARRSARALGTPSLRCVSQSAPLPSHTFNRPPCLVSQAVRECAGGGVRVLGADAFPFLCP